MNDDVKKLFENYMRIENEIKMLQEDKKQTLAEFKDRVTPKVFKAALGAARAKARLKSHESDEFDQVMMVLEGEFSVEHVE